MRKTKNPTNSRIRFAKTTPHSLFPPNSTWRAHSQRKAKKQVEAQRFTASSFTKRSSCLPRKQRGIAEILATPSLKQSANLRYLPSAVMSQAEDYMTGAKPRLPDSEEQEATPTETDACTHKLSLPPEAFAATTAQVSGCRESSGQQSPPEISIDATGAFLARSIFTTRPSDSSPNGAPRAEEATISLDQLRHATMKEEIY